MKIAVDFDGVMVERYGVPRKGGFSDCPPTENAIESIQWMRKKGHSPYILTNREPKEWKKIHQWLSSNKIRMKVTNIKEKGTHIYLDDRAVRFTNWQDFCKLLG